MYDTCHMVVTYVTYTWSHDTKKNIEDSETNNITTVYNI